MPQRYRALTLRFWGQLALFMLVLPACFSQAGELRIAVAANFTQTLKQLATQFEARHPHKVTLISGSSGKLYAQIHHGAPYDLFFSADQQKPSALIQSGHAQTQLTYAQGTLVLLGQNTVNQPKGNTQNLKVDDTAQALKQRFTQGKFNRLSLANPKHAPYGRAAIAAINHAELNHTRARWLTAENIAQAFQFFDTGHADLALVALSQVVGTNQHAQKRHYWPIPSTWYPAIKQDAVLLSRAKNNTAAQDFWAFIKSPQATKLIRSHGYTVD